MKKFNVIISIAAISAAFACSKEESPSVVEQKPDVTPTSNYVISATAPGAQDTPEATRTTIEINDGKGLYKWVKDDAISLFGEDGTTLGKFTTSIEEPDKTADFVGDEPIVKPKYAIYPYNGNAKCTTDGIITTEIPVVQDGKIHNALSYAVSENGKNFSFNNATSVIKLDFNPTDKICGVTVQFEEPVAGNVKLNCTTGKISGATSNVVRVKSSQALSGTVYLNIAPTATKNISLTFITLDDQVATLGATVKSGFVAGNIKPLGTVQNLNFSYTLKAFAKEFVKVLDVWRNTVGRVDADPKHNNTTHYSNVHLIPIEKGKELSYSYKGNQHDDNLYPTKFTVKLGDKTYTSAQTWEIAQRGMLDLVTKEGSAELNNFSDRNHPMTLADGVSLFEPLPSYSTECKWGAAPWYEEDREENGNKPLTYNGYKIDGVDIEFMVKVGAWHVVRSFINVGSNNPLNAIGNYQQFGDSPDLLILEGYSGLICPIRELLILARFYKYLLDKNIDENIYSAVVNQSFDFDLYGRELSPTLKDFAKEFVGILDLWEGNVVNSQHKVPSDASIKVFGVTYDRAKMFGTAAQGYLNLSGDNYTLNDTIPTNLHINSWAGSAYSENTQFKITNGNKVGFNLLTDATNRQINYAKNNNKTYANYVGYDKNQVTGYDGLFCLERHLLVLARFYKYLLDNDLDNAKDIIDSKEKVLDPTLY